MNKIWWRGGENKPVIINNILFINAGLLLLRIVLDLPPAQPADQRVDPECLLMRDLHVAQHGRTTGWGAIKEGENNWDGVVSDCWHRCAGAAAGAAGEVLESEDEYAGEGSTGDAGPRS